MVTLCLSHHMTILQFPPNPQTPTNSTIPGPETCRQMLAEVLASNDKLFHLDISYNAIGTEAAVRRAE